MCNNDIKNNNYYFSKNLISFAFAKNFDKDFNLINNAYKVINKLKCYYNNRWNKNDNNKCNAWKINKNQFNETLKKSW